jgi:LPPG:FO 2-phospho-L-lactate transferase
MGSRQTREFLCFGGIESSAVGCGTGEFIESNHPPRLLDCHSVKVTALAGGVGGAKLLHGLARVLGGDLTAVVNTGDDHTAYGVRVSPDVDIVTYWLAGVADEARGWGIAGDTFEVVGALRELGEDAWFLLGDRDFATCIRRTQRLGQGASLSVIVDEIRRAFGVSSTILPMSNDPVRTRLELVDGRTLEFQEYFVKERHQPDVKAVILAGLEDAKPAPGVLDALAAAERVVVCPSNPFVSIAPILALPGVRDTLRTHAKVIAVSPIVGGRALKGPADRLLASLVGDRGAGAVSKLYSDFVDVFVVDTIDLEELTVATDAGVQAVARDTIMRDHEAAEALARALLEL